MLRENNLKTTPIPVVKSKRTDRKTVITSSPAGKITPVGVIPLLREDRVQSGRMAVSVEAMEMAEPIFNGINVKVSAYLVPKLAEDNFNGMDDLNRAYMGVPREEGETPIDFIKTHTFDRDDEFYKTLGIHAIQGSSVNRQYLEAYNLVVNHMRTEVSKSIEHRTMTDATLAPAFWNNPHMNHIKADFDQAIIDGEVSLNSGTGGLKINGLVGRNEYSIDASAATFYDNDGDIGDDGNSYFTYVGAKKDPNSWATQVFAELEQGGITVSLSNIELAKKTQAFARMRQDYQGHSDQYIIDLLMSGINIPTENLRHPILLAEKTSQMGYQQRFATDASNLDEHVTVGGTVVDISMTVPPITCGGTIIVVAQIVPDNLFERTQDLFLTTTDTSDYPEFTKNFLDPEPVEIVKNGYIDQNHSDPDSVFGYAPLNHGYMRSTPNIGGKYYRPQVDASFDEERQKFWANEKIDVELSSDWYLCSDIHHKIFADSTVDNFEITAKGEFSIIGNTVFGPAIRESTDDYDQVIADVDQTRLTK